LPAIKLIIFNRGSKAIRQLYIARKPEASGIEVKFPAELTQDPHSHMEKTKPFLKPGESPFGFRKGKNM